MSYVLGTMNIAYPHSSCKDATIQNYRDIIEAYIQSCLKMGETPILDTAYYYGNTETEKILGEIMEYGKLSTQPKIASKANPWLNNDFTNGVLGQLNKRGIEHQITTSLNHLKLDCLDIFYLHCPDHETSIIETLETCDDLWRREKFTHWGLSNYSQYELQKALFMCDEFGYTPPKYYQGMYNLICRGVEEVFPLLNEFNMEFWGYNPLAGGLLTGKYYKERNSNSDSRFKGNAIYQNIFWKEPILQELESFFENDVELCTEYSFQWLKNYSMMKNARANDKIILGVSSLDQFRKNMNYLNNPSLEKYTDEVVFGLNNLYDLVKPWSPSYFY